MSANVPSTTTNTSYHPNTVALDTFDIPDLILPDGRAVTVNSQTPVLPHPDTGAAMPVPPTATVKGTLWDALKTIFAGGTGDIAGAAVGGAQVGVDVSTGVFSHWQAELAVLLLALILIGVAVARMA